MMGEKLSSMIFFNVFLRNWLRGSVFMPVVDMFRPAGRPKGPCMEDKKRTSGLILGHHESLWLLPHSNNAVD